MADEFAAIAKAAFLAGALSETKKQATKAGKSTVKTGAKLAKKTPRVASAYAKRYGRAFKRLAPKYKTKSGKWKKDGFKRCGAAARKEAKK